MANGIVGLRSVKGIFLEKVCHIVVPKQTKHPDDPEGDSKDDGNYKFAGEVGEGPAQINPSSRGVMTVQASVAPSY
jgi:hypothetical protein